MAHGGKHWTFDCGTTVNDQSHYTENLQNIDLLIPGSANTSVPAFLIRPISNNSLSSSNHLPKDDKRSMSISPQALAAAVAAASSSIKADGGTFMSKSDRDVSENQEHFITKKYQRNLLHSSCKLRKQTPSASGETKNIEKEDMKIRYAKGNIELWNNGNILPTHITSEYAPMEFEDPLKSNILHLHRQHSDAAAYGTKHAQKLYFNSNCRKISTKNMALIGPAINSRVMKSSHSHPGITMLRDNACSLVDIPTYLGPSLQACGGVELLTVNQEINTTLHSPIPSVIPNSKAKATAPLFQCHSNFQDQSKVLSSTNKKSEYGQIPAPGLPIELGNQPQHSRKKQKLEKQRKAKRTVLCVSIALFLMCITVVGTMLSIGSNYQVTDGYVSLNQFTIFKSISNLERIDNSTIVLKSNNLLPHVHMYMNPRVAFHVIELCLTSPIPTTGQT